MKKSKVIINSLVEKLAADADSHAREVRALTSRMNNREDALNKKIHELQAIVFIWQKGSKQGFLDIIYQSIEHYKDSDSASNYETLETLLEILEDKIKSYSELKQGADFSERDLHKRAKESLEKALYE